MIVATVDPALGHRGQASFIVEKGTPGFGMGKKEDKLGIRASQTAELVLDDVRVPMENLLGGPDRLERKLERARSGERSRASGALATFEVTRPMVGASALGIARAAYEWTIDRLEGEADEHGPLLEQQRVQQVLADVATEIDAARLLVWRATWMGRNGVPMTGGQGSMSKLKAGDVAMWATTALMDLVGPEAGLTDHPLEKWFRDAKIYQLFEGTAQVQRLVISRMQVAERRQAVAAEAEELAGEAADGARPRTAPGPRTAPRPRTAPGPRMAPAPRMALRPGPGPGRSAPHSGPPSAPSRPPGHGAAAAAGSHRGVGNADASPRRARPRRSCAPRPPHICGRPLDVWTDGRSPLLGICLGRSGDCPIPCMQRRIPGRSGERGTQGCLGRISWSSARGAGSFRASPSANPAGRRKRVVVRGTPLMFICALFALALIAAPTAMAADGPGGVAYDEPPAAPPAAPGATGATDLQPTVPGVEAKIVDGLAAAPAAAPDAVKQAIWAANASSAARTATAAATPAGSPTAATTARGPSRSPSTAATSSTARSTRAPSCTGARRARATGSPSTRTPATRTP